MIYLDYSATTKPNEEVIKSYVKASNEFIGNPNSLHKLGVNSNNLINAATKQIADTFKINSEEIIYTSGASESNNLALKGVIDAYSKKNAHIITTNFEHSSIYGPLNYLSTKNVNVDIVDTDQFGKVDIESLKKLINNDTLLVTIGAVNSEIGIIQDVENISKIIKEINPKTLLHVDYTQAIGKMEVNFKNVDLASLSAHKFFGLKGIGILYKNKSIRLEPLIHGGKSTTIFRSGTPALPLIVSTAKALRLATNNIFSNYKLVENYNHYLREELSKIKGVHINSPIDALPFILNISIPGIKPETMLHALEEYEIYISTQTACAGSSLLSSSVLALTNNEEYAKSSIRISISYITTKEELIQFIKVFEKCVKELTFK